jgi:tuberous sclerosis protein 2
VTLQTGMSRQLPDVDPQKRSRPRANTTSFTPFAWRRQRNEHPVPPVPQQPLPLEALIEALTPPAVPSLAYARALASTLSTASPLPRREVFNPILSCLCDVQKPVAIQAAGYDILSAYCENNEALRLTTYEKLFYFSFFPESGLAWGMELWEPRFKALRAVTKYGEDVLGIETNLIDTLKRWIKGAFDGLLQNDSPMERAERPERERSIDVLVQFLADILQKPENISRIPEDVAADVLQFYADLVNRSVILPLGPTTQDRILAPVVVPNPPSNNNTPSKSLHKRNASSLSISSIPSAHSAAKPSSLKHPGELAISLYLSYLSSQLKSLSPEYLQDIHPVLFRALAFSASPLPRLTVLPRKESSQEEEKITETLSALLAGPYTTICMRILKKHLFPPKINEPFPRRSPEGLSEEREGACQQLDIMTSLGAHRMLRNFIRRALSMRLERAYRETSINTGAPGHIELESDLKERAWPKDDYASSAGGNGWDAGRLGKVLASSVHAWVTWGSDMLRSRGEEDKPQSWEKQREGQDTILEEAAGVLKDILQEMDSREYDVMGLDEEEAIVVGETLQNLAGYVLLLK